MLYHREVHWPRRIANKLPFNWCKMVYTKHAQQAAQTDRYAIAELPAYVNMADAVIFEAEENDKGKPLAKVCLRLRYDDVYDLVFAATPHGFTLVVRTVWLNERNDGHKTLDRKKYARA